MERATEWLMFEKAVEITASALRGSLGGEKSQPPKFVGDVFREVWSALKEASADLPDRGRTGF